MRRCLLLLAIISSPAYADGWTQFRGLGSGKLDEVRHPLKWSNDENVLWSIPMAGNGWSSPVVAGNRVFVTSAESDDGGRPKGMMAGVASMRSFRNAKPGKHRYVVSCFSLEDGNLLWRKVVGESVPPVVHPSNTYATESPATDGKRLFTFFATTGTLTAWDLDGEPLWQRELGAYRAGNGFGSGSSLATIEGLVYVQNDNDENSFVAAFDTRSGGEVWRVNRPAKTSWSTPLVWKNQARVELVTCGSDVVTSYDASSGSVIWKLTGMKSGFSGSPAVDLERIYFGTSGPSSAGPLVAIPAGTKGDVPLDNDFKHEKAAWSRVRSGPGMASPVVTQGLLYISGSGGILNCYDTATGERVYRTRVNGMATVAASLWADDDHVFILDENGTTHVIQAGREFAKVATNKIDDLFWSTPAIAGNRLLLRGVSQLYCIGTKAK